MKRVLMLFALFCSFSVQSQRFAYVDSKYILENMDEYQEAQNELNEVSKKWQQTVEAKYASIDQLYKEYQAEKILLTEQMRKKREEEIVEKEKEAREYQRKKFGVEGELFKKRQELIQPLQDQIFEAIDKLAKERSYALIFDKAGGGGSILYSDPKYDKSEAILRKLGLSGKDK